MQRMREQNWETRLLRFPFKTSRYKTVEEKVSQITSVNYDSDISRYSTKQHVKISGTEGFDQFDVNGWRSSRPRFAFVPQLEGSPYWQQRAYQVYYWINNMTPKVMSTSSKIYEKKSTNILQFRSTGQRLTIPGVPGNNDRFISDIHAGKIMLHYHNIVDEREYTREFNSKRFPSWYNSKYDKYHIRYSSFDKKREYAPYRFKHFLNLQPGVFEEEIKLAMRPIIEEAEGQADVQSPFSKDNKFSLPGKKTGKIKNNNNFLNDGPKTPTLANNRGIKLAIESVAEKKHDLFLEYNLHNFVVDDYLRYVSAFSYYSTASPMFVYPNEKKDGYYYHEAGLLLKEHIRQVTGGLWQPCTDKIISDMVEHLSRIDPTENYGLDIGKLRGEDLDKGNVNFTPLVPTYKFKIK